MKALSTPGESPAFPMPDVRLALFDIDKTLIGVDLVINDEGIFDAFAEAQAQGWTVGLSSDTPYDRIRSKRDYFGVNGPIIAERGAIVEWDGSTIYDSETAQAFGETRDRVEAKLAERGFRVVSSYPTELDTPDDRPIEDGEAIAFVNPLRMCSVGLWARRSRDDRLVIDDNLTSEMADLVRPDMPDMDLFWDLNHEYGILIAAPASMNKRVGTQHFKQLAGIGGRVAMVGDSMSDFLGDDVAVHYAVGNASPDFKARANYVAEGTITKGSIEILGKLRGAS
jgi:hydroxymethylpyrimidine pyrophosphatase-like HAD family hydrolase